MESLVDKERPGEEILHIFYDGVKMMVRRQESWESEDFDFLKSEKFYEIWWHFLMTIYSKKTFLGYWKNNAWMTFILKPQFYQDL